MAIDEITLDAGRQQAVARQLAMDDVKRKQERAQQKHVRDQAKQLKRGISQAVDPLQITANQGYRKIWQYGQEVAEDTAIAFADFMIFSGPATVIIYLVRLVVGNFFSGGRNITYQNFSVPMVPGYSPVEGIYRTLKFLYVAAVTGILYTTIIFVLYVFSNPGETAQIFWLSFACWLTQLFGNVCQ